jgi:streptogramin lyase
VKLRHSLALVPAVALVCACQVWGGKPSDSPRSIGPGNRPVTNDPTPGVEALAVGAGPVGLAPDPDGGVWVVSAQADSVAHFAADATTADRTVHVGGTPLRATAAYGALWVTAFRAEELVRIDLAAGRITDRIPTGAGPEGVVAAFGSVWVVAQDAGRLLRVDPQTRTVTERIDIGVGARLVVAGRHWLYVSHFADGQVLRIDPGSGEVTRSHEVCQGPQGMTVEHGRLWVACTTGNRVLVLEAGNLDVVDRLHGPEAPDPVALAPDGTVLVVSQSGPTVVSINPTTREPIRRLRLGDADQLYDQANIDAVVADGLVWVSSFNDDTVLRTPVP